MRDQHLAALTEDVGDLTVFGPADDDIGPGIGAGMVVERSG